MPTQDDALFEYLLRLGDTDVVLAQRLGEWVGHGPVLEEDIALTNVGLDLLGQGRMWLSLRGRGRSARAAAQGRSEDELAFLRDGGAFRNLQLVEMPNGDFATTMARQFYFDQAHLLLLRALARSTDARVAEIAAKAVKEVTYHAERSADWVIRLGDGTDESHARMQRALDALWPYTGEMFAADAIELRADRRRHRRRRARRCASRGSPRCDAVLAEATLALPARRVDAGRATAAAASRACTPSISATCWPRCSTCSARIRARSGDGHVAEATARSPRRRPRSTDAGRVDVVWDALATVPDPEIPVISIVELGIVRDVAWDGGRLRVEVTPTYSGCPATEMIATLIRERLAAIGVPDVELVQRLSPPWSTDWIAPEAKAQARGVRHRAAASVAARRIDVAGISPLRRAGVVVPCPRCGSAQHASCCRSSARPRARRSTAATTASSRSTISSRTDGLPRARLTMSKFHPTAHRQRRARDARRRRDHVRRARSAARAVPLRAGPAPDAARRHRRRGRAPLLFDLLGRAGRRAAHRGQEEPGRRVLDVGERRAEGRRHDRRHAAARALQRAARRRRARATTWASPPAAASRRSCRS